ADVAGGTVVVFEPAETQALFDRVELSQPVRLGGGLDVAVLTFLGRAHLPAERLVQPPLREFPFGVQSPIQHGHVVLLLADGSFVVSCVHIRFPVGRGQGQRRLLIRGMNTGRESNAAAAADVPGWCGCCRNDRTGTTATGGQCWSTRCRGSPCSTARFDDPGDATGHTHRVIVLRGRSTGGVPAAGSRSAPRSARVPRRKPAAAATRCRTVPRSLPCPGTRRRSPCHRGSARCRGRSRRAGRFRARAARTAYSTDGRSAPRTRRSSAAPVPSGAAHPAPPVDSTV